MVGFPEDEWTQLVAVHLVSKPLLTSDFQLCLTNQEMPCHRTVQLDLLIMLKDRPSDPNVWCFQCVWQVVELISSAIGDVVQGIYSENNSTTEVHHCDPKNIRQALDLQVCRCSQSFCGLCCHFTELLAPSYCQFKFSFFFEKRLRIN